MATESPIADVEDVGLAESTVAADDADLVLPPLPQPRRGQLLAESWCGVKTILIVIAIVLLMTHLVILNEDAGVLSATARRACLAIVYAEVAVTLLSLERLLRGDPGTIKRSDATSRPIPAAVADALRRYPNAPEVVGISSNVDDPVLGSYCVRCCVWRRPRSKSHHCSLCQRCVVDFDHHCSFYGRCIAGVCRPTKMTGNLPYFYLILAMGQAAFFTCVVFLGLALFGRHA